MFFNYKDNDVYYNIENEHAEEVILFLHGWGSNSEAFRGLIDIFKTKYKVVYLDFPGFGNSKEPNNPFYITDYIELTKALLSHLNISKFTIIGHSMGCRVASSISADRYILIGAAGIKPKRDASYYVKVYTYKTFKFISKIPVLNWITSRPYKAYTMLFSSADYKSASPVMKRTLSNVVNQDMRENYKTIKSPTLLIFGENDLDTPVSDGKIIESLVEQSALITIKSAGHYTFIDKQHEVVAIIRAFLNEDTDFKTDSKTLSEPNETEITKEVL